MIYHDKKTRDSLGRHEVWKRAVYLLAAHGNETYVRYCICRQTLHHRQVHDVAAACQSIPDYRSLVT
ncbi:MAG: hypothetical protein M3Y41_14205 [Pseudomonadota bacterium]|nr:hypothetical protein [Pseudomonadota bacterium]